MFQVSSRDFLYHVNRFDVYEQDVGKFFYQTTQLGDVPSEIKIEKRILWMSGLHAAEISFTPHQISKGSPQVSLDC